MHVLAFRSITAQQSLPAPPKDWSVDHLNMCLGFGMASRVHEGARGTNPHMHTRGIKAHLLVFLKCLGANWVPQRWAAH